MVPPRRARRCSQQVSRTSATRRGGSNEALVLGAHSLSMIPALALLAGSPRRRLDPNGRPLLVFALLTCLPVGYAYGSGGGISVHFRIFEAMAQVGFAVYLLWVSRSSVSVAVVAAPASEPQPTAHASAPPS